MIKILLILFNIMSMTGMTILNNTNNVTDITEDARENFSMILQQINADWTDTITITPVPTIFQSDHIVIYKNSSRFEFIIMVAITITILTVYFLSKRR